MKFKIDFTTIPSVTVECPVTEVESYARLHCVENGMDPATGVGPLPLSIQRIFDALCKPCAEQNHEFCERIILGTDQLPAPKCECPQCEEKPPRCGWCGSEELTVDHNTAHGFYCSTCDLVVGNEEE
jgi:hypothetical protein